MIRDEVSPQALVRALAEQEVPPEPKEVMLTRRERAIGGIERAIRQSAMDQERRTQRRRRFAMLGVAAAIALSVFGVHQAVQRPLSARADRTDCVATVESVRGTLVVTQRGRSRVVAAGEHPELFAGDELRTAADGGVSIRTERSATEVAPATQLRVLAPSAAEERIRLALGRVDLHVFKQAKARRSVLVETPHAEVIVRGTMFSVAVEANDSRTRTLVRVREGSVWVLSGGSRNLVSAGEEWSSLDRAPSSDGDSAPTSAGEPRERAEKAVTVSAPSTPGLPVQKQVREARRAGPRRVGEKLPAAPAESGSLAEENRLFEAAILARKRHEDRQVVEMLGTQLARYPTGRLSEEARVERMRALRRLGETIRAAAEARLYLSKYGEGFAREEARDVALGGR